MPQSSQQSRLHQNIKAAGWVSLFTDLSSEMIYPLLPLFLKVVLSASTVFIGLIEGLAETTAALLKIISGKLSDRFRKRKILILSGYGLSAFVRPLMSVTTAAWQVLFLRVSDRVGKGVRTSPRDALIADCTKPEERGMAFGFQRAMDHAGAFLGPLIGAALLWLFSEVWVMSQANALRLIFALAVIPGILSLFVIILFMKDVVSEKKQALTKAGTEKINSRAYKIFLAAICLFALGNSSDAFLILRANETGISLWQIPLLWACFHAVKMLSTAPFGKLSDRMGRKKILLTGWSLYAVCYLLFAITQSAIMFWVIFLLYGLFYGLTEGAERALVADLTLQKAHGTAFGWYHGLVGIMALPASLIFGFLWQTTGTTFVPFIFGAVAAGLAAILLLRIKMSDAVSCKK